MTARVGERDWAETMGGAPNNDDQFVDELVAIHARLISHGAPRDVGTPSTQLPAAAHDELSAAADVFQLIQRVRKSKDDCTQHAIDESTRVGSQQGKAMDSVAEQADESSYDDLFFASGRKIGRFTIKRELGQGGYGIVFLAQDADLDRLVALKVPRPQLIFNTEAQLRFVREGKAAALLSHPNIVPVFETGRVGRICFIVSAHVDGVTLADWLSNRASPCDPSVAARLLAALAGAIQHAHSKGVFHRDLKPSNILLAGYSDASRALDNGPDAARITDFGLAKVVGEQSALTQSQAIMGTPAYMPPEQANHRGEVAGAPSDVYSLGAILYELLAGQPPFVAETALRTLQLVQNIDAVPVRKKNAQIPADLDAICLKCLEKDPARRYASANALEQDLQRFLAGQPVVARSVTQVEQAMRWCKRNPRFAIMATALLLSLLLGVSLVGLQYRRTAAKNQELQVMNDFLVDSFKRPYPDVDGRDITLASLLDRQMEQVKLNEDLPVRTRASLALSLGRAYHGLGLFEEAISAYGFAKSVLSSSDALRLEINNRLGFALVDAGRFEDALDVLEPTAESMLRRLGADHTKTRWVSNHLALAYLGAGDSERALEIMETLYQSMDQQPDLTDEDQHQTLTNYGHVLAKAEDYDEAIPIQQRSVALARQEFGSDHPHTLTGINNLATSYVYVGRHTDAVPLLEQNAKACSAILGQSHPQTLNAKNSLAGAYWNSGDLAKALPILEAVVANFEQQLGSDHPSTLGTKMNLGAAYLFSKQTERAVETLDSASQQMAAALGANHAISRKTLGLLAQACSDAGNDTKAEEILRKLIQAQRANGANPTTRLANLLFQLADVHQRNEDNNAALSLLHEALSLYNRDPSHPWQIGKAQSLLGLVLVKQGNLEKGRALLEVGKRTLEKMSERIPAYCRAAELLAADERQSKAQDNR